MKEMKKLTLAVLAIAALSGCASTQVAGLAPADGAGAPAANLQATEQKVSRALPSYGSRGGYRYRRLAAVAVPS